MFLIKGGWKLGIAGLGLLALGICFGCGEDEVTGPPTDKVAAGWRSFESGDYQSGITQFSAAGAEAPGWGEPFSGLGWCYAGLVRTYRSSGQGTLANDNLLLAETNFDLAKSKDADLTDAWAGLAIVRLALQKYEQGGVAAFQAVELGQDKYVFQHDSTVTANALRVVLAECVFYLGDYSEAERQVELVDFALILESSDPDYLELLLEAIGRLSRE